MTSIMSSPSWTAPHWSHPPPTATWNLLKIKQGTLLTTHPLTSLSSHRQGCITFGHIDDPTHIDIVTARKLFPSSCTTGSIPTVSHSYEIWDRIMGRLSIM
eukprot:CCRYP_019257-RA/>CCRYP_019257-RA protein AED:0.43 eAED:0.39 QI:0/-1/0/1/-1/1/1/0/100